MPPFSSSSIVIATRESRLALWQARHVRALLEARGHRVTLLGMTTRGDQILDRTLSKVGGKGLFVKELEAALEDGRADIAVHSLKDVPMELPDGFALACVLERDDPRDAWVSPLHASLQALPAGAVVGTSSLRRAMLLRALRPDVRIAALRGNLDTRLKKLDDGHYAGIVLAAAGLSRLGLQARMRHAFDTDAMLPAAGQGALGIEIRTDRADLLRTLAPLDHAPTRLATAAERAVSRALGGSCSMPLAAYACFEDGGGGAAEDTGDQGTLWLRAAWGDGDVEATPDGSPVASTTESRVLHAEARARVDDESAAVALGHAVADRLRAAGARS